MLHTYYIETFGCQMNKSDSELMNLSLSDKAFQAVHNPGQADIVIFNTCSVRQHAEDRAKARIQAIEKDVHGRNGIIVVSGCMAQRTGAQLVETKIADLVIGPYQGPKIGEIITLFLNDRKHNLFLSQDSDQFEARINPLLTETDVKAPWHKWVTITHGCENFCTYCIVPYVRGKLISFKSETILDYIRLIADHNIKEITLLGQNVNQYGTDNNDIPFYKLLEKAAATKGIERINFLTSHPKDFSENIIAVINDNSNISRSIHLPLQSGSDPVLKAMNRGYTVNHYMNIVQSIDKIMGEYSITTDLIVGFPGESEQDFNNTLTILHEVQFDDAYTYAYSPRSGTPAYDIPEEMTKQEKTDRLNILISTQREISTNKLKTQIGKTNKLIAEKISKKSTEKVMGKTFLNHPVVIPGNGDDIGKLIPIRITNLRGSTLQGEPIVQ